MERKWLAITLVSSLLLLRRYEAQSLPPQVSDGTTIPPPKVPDGTSTPPKVPDGTTIPPPKVPDGTTSPPPKVPDGTTSPQPKVPNGTTSPPPKVTDGTATTSPGPSSNDRCNVENIRTGTLFCGVSSHAHVNESSSGSDFEDPEMFTPSRIKMGITPILNEIQETDPLTFFDMKIAWAHRFLIRNSKCDLIEFNSIMGSFWDHFFRGTFSIEEIEQFGFRFWNVSVEFDPGEESTIVEGHCSKLAKGRAEPCLVKKKEQLKRQENLCFSGALLECSQETETCICLETHGTKTVRVNPRSGVPDPEGTACFVMESQPCHVKHYGTPALRLPCAYNYECDFYTGYCLKEPIRY